MTEQSRYWSTTDVGDGPAAGYTAADMYDFLRRLLIPGGEASQGVLRGVEDELVVTGSSSPLSMATGAAIVYGLFYENSAALNLAVTTPVTGVTGGRVNLKADWTLQTVRATVQLNTDGVAAIPDVVQTAGSEWSLPVYTFTINQAGTISSLTRVAEYCQFANWLEAAMFDLAAGLSVIGRSSGSAGPAGEITADSDGLALVRVGGVLDFGQVPTAGIANAAVTVAKLADEAITTAKIANNAIDDTKAGNRVPQFYRRQGGNAADWSLVGSNNYTPTAVRMQAGTIGVTVNNGYSSGQQAVTFPVAFSDKPLVFLSVVTPDTGISIYSVRANSIAANGFTAMIQKNNNSGTITLSVSWLAVGPE